MDLHSAQDRKGGRWDCVEGWNPAKCCVSNFEARGSLGDLFFIFFFYSWLENQKIELSAEAIVRCF